MHKVIRTHFLKLLSQVQTTLLLIKPARSLNFFVLVKTAIFENYTSFLAVIYKN